MSDEEFERLVREKKIEHYLLGAVDKANAEIGYVSPGEWLKALAALLPRLWQKDNA